MLNQQNDLKSLVSQSLFTAIGAQPTYAHAGTAHVGPRSNKYSMQTKATAGARYSGTTSSYTPYGAQKNMTMSSVSMSNKFAGKAGGVRMSSMSG